MNPGLLSENRERNLQAMPPPAHDILAKYNWNKEVILFSMNRQIVDASDRHLSSFLPIPPPTTFVDVETFFYRRHKDVRLTSSSNFFVVFRCSLKMNKSFDSFQKTLKKEIVEL